MKERYDITIADLLANMPEIWGVLSDHELQVLLASSRVVEYKKNEQIYNEGEAPRYLMCLLKGKVRIYKNGICGRSQIIRMVRPNHIFAYRAFFAEEMYVTSASAFEPSVVCLIPVETIESAVKLNNAFACCFIRELAVDLGIADERIVTLTQKHIRGRLAEALMFLIDSYGLEDDGATISIYLSREDLANLSNMTTSNAIRTLSTFVNEHIIALDGRKIKIIDLERLDKISKLG